MIHNCITHSPRREDARSEHTSHYPNTNVETTSSHHIIGGSHPLSQANRSCCRARTARSWRRVDPERGGSEPINRLHRAGLHPAPPLYAQPLKQQACIENTLAGKLQYRGLGREWANVIPLIRHGWMWKMTHRAHREDPGLTFLLSPRLKNSGESGRGTARPHSDGHIV